MSRADLVAQITTELVQLDEARLRAVLTLLSLARGNRPDDKGTLPSEKGVSTAQGLVWSQVTIALENAERLNEFGEAAAVGAPARVVRRS